MFAEDVSAIFAAHADEHQATSEGDQRLTVARAIWELVALFFVEPGGGTGVVTEELVEWFQRHASVLQLSPDALPARVGALLAAIQQAGPKPEAAPGFWECFASMVAVGWTDPAIDLLMLHSCWGEWRMGKAAVKPVVELLEAMVALLRTAPRLGAADRGIDGGLFGRPGSVSNASNPFGSNASSATSVPQFLAFREAWTRQVREVLADGALFDECFDTPAAEGVRATLSVLAGDETAVARATPGGWLELMIASVRHRYPQLRAHGELASLAHRCIGAKGPGDLADMNRLLLAVIEVNASEVVGVCSHHLDTWFLAHVAELLVAAAGEGFVTGVVDPAAGALANSPYGDGGETGVGLLSGGAYRPGGGAVRGGSAPLTGAVLRRPVAQGGTQAELYLVEYCCTLATRAATRRLALRYLPHCHARGAGVMSHVLRVAAPAPGPWALGAAAPPGVEPRAIGSDGGIAEEAVFAATFEALETCRAWGLRDAALGVARGAAAAARARGDQHDAVAWLHRVGDVAGVAALALQQLPTAADAAADPGSAAAALMRLAEQHPGLEEHPAGRRGRGHLSAVTAAGPAGFLDALAELRATLGELAVVGPKAAAAEAERAMASGGGEIPEGKRAGGAAGAAASAAVAAPATAATARLGGAILTALLSHGAGQRHLWREALFQAVPLLEGAHAALDPAEIQLCMARLEQMAALGCNSRGDLDARAQAAMGLETDLRVAVARTALARAYAHACVAHGGGAGTVRC